MKDGAQAGAVPLRANLGRRRQKTHQRRLDKGVLFLQAPIPGASIVRRCPVAPGTRKALAIGLHL